MPTTLANGDLHCLALKPLLLPLELADAANRAVHANEYTASEEFRTLKRLRLVSFPKQVRLPTLHP